MMMKIGTKQIDRLLLAEPPVPLVAYTPGPGAARARYLRRAWAEIDRNAGRLRDLRGRHKGRRAFILGNGPSIKRMDLSPLRDEITFAVNSTFRLYPELGWQATYTCITDRVRWIEMGGEVLAASPDSQCFYCDDWEVPTPPDLFTAEQRNRLILLHRQYRLPRWLSALMPMRNDRGFYHYHRAFGRHFAWDVTGGVCLGNSVIFTAAQLAVWMGCDPVILLGVDMDYSGAARHFHDKPIWSPPMDYETDAKPWFESFRRETEARGVRFLNGTVGGRVDALERVNYASLFPAPLSAVDRVVA